ncbi:MAG: M56 family metallopeptidase [Planctomycetaceae bacterium]
MSLHLLGTIVNQSLVETLGWVLLHSVWQLFVVALLVWFIERSLRRVSSSSRYALQLVALLIMSACPVVTWCKMEPVPGSVVTDLPSGEAVAFLPSEEDAAAGSALPADSAAMPRASFNAKEAARQPTQKNSGWRDQLLSILRPWLSTMVAAWSFGVLVFSLRPIAGWVSVYRLRSRGASAAPEFVREKLQALCETLQVRRHVDVLVSRLVSSPVVIGCYRSLILLPASFATSVPVTQLEAILAHELAHVKRYDYFTNLMQTLMETLFFYHPAVWWLSSRIRIERENCCDDLVVTALNNHLDYGKALLAVEEYRTHSAVLALNARGGSLLARVRRILSVPADDAGPGSASILALVCLLTCLVAGLSWSAAVAGNDEAAAVAKDEKTTKEPAKATESVPPDSHALTAALTENLSVELLAIHEHWKTKADNGKHTVAPAPVWRGHGEVYAAPPQLPEWYDGSPQYAEGTRHVLFQCRGLSAGQQVACRADEIKSYLHPDESGIVRAIVEPLGSPNSASFHVGVTDVEWGPWVKVDPDGEEQEDVEIPADCRDVYNRIGVSHVSLVGNESRFAWIGLKGVDDTAQADLVAVDKSGKRHDPVAGTFEGSPPRHLSVDIFNIPREQLDHFEFRLRPYRYWVTFDDVSLKPGQKSSPKATVKTVPIQPPKSSTANNQSTVDTPPEQTAHLSDVSHELPVRLLGVRSLDDPKTAWSGDGSLVAVTEKWPQPLRVASGDISTHDFVISCQQLQDGQTIVFDDLGHLRRFTTPSKIVSPSVFSFSGKPGDDRVMSFRLGITESWGPWQAADSDGTLRAAPEMSALQKDTYSALKKFHVMHDLIGLEGVAGDINFDYEVAAVDVNGIRHNRSGAGVWEVANASVPYFDLSEYKLDHWEFRIRKVRRWISFSNVSLEPGAKTDFKIAVSENSVSRPQGNQGRWKELPESQDSLPFDGQLQSLSGQFARYEDLDQKLAEAKKAAAEKDQPIAIMVAVPDSEQARWFHALLRGTAEDREGIVIDDESLKAIRDGIRKCRVLWLDAAQLEELKKLIPDHELEEKQNSAMIFLKPDGTWFCHFEPDPKNEPERSVKNLRSAIEHTAKTE